MWVYVLIQTGILVKKKIGFLKRKQEMPTPMTKKIYSNLDLTKSLSDFQEKVTKLLEITNIKEWNGQTFKAHEEKIRESALILAGECISLLLHNLAQSQEVLLTAMNQTQGWWHQTTRKHGTIKQDK